jgi:hypothetical protein
MLMACHEVLFQQWMRSSPVNELNWTESTNTYKTVVDMPLSIRTDVYRTYTTQISSTIPVSMAASGKNGYQYVISVPKDFPVSTSTAIIMQMFRR